MTTSSIPHSPGDPSQYSKTRGKRHKVWKGRSKCLLFPDNRIVHMRSPAKMHKLLKIRAYMTVIGYKLKIEKAITFLDLSLKQLKNERTKMSLALA